MHNKIYETEAHTFLNLGHTFGHMLERTITYNSNCLIHGESVAIEII
uniref:3-dehydroquinate synthase n=1 Tax=Bartonella rochalimae ATCC BAA-1498 TaxID=685782 RepID=E6YNP7_9HYPH